MKIERSGNKSSPVDVPADCQRIIDEVVSCSEDELHSVLARLSRLSFAECELSYFADVFDRFDSLLESATKRTDDNEWALEIELPGNVEQMQTLISVLRFSKHLLDSVPRERERDDQYASLDRLVALLSCASHCELVVGLLQTILTVVRRFERLARTFRSESKLSLTDTLTTLIDGCAIRDQQATLVQCCQPVATGAPAPRYATVHIEYRVDSGQLHQVHINVWHKMVREGGTRESPASLIRAVLLRANVPRAKRAALFSALRAAHWLTDEAERRRAAEVRLLALAAYAPLDAAKSFLTPRFLQDLAELFDVHVPDDCYTVRCAALQFVTSLVFTSSTSQGSMRLAMLVDTLQLNAYHGSLCKFARTALQRLVSQTSDPNGELSESEPTGQSVALLPKQSTQGEYWSEEDALERSVKAVLDLARTLAQKRAGCDALRQSSVADAVLRLLSWHNEAHAICNWRHVAAAVDTLCVLTQHDGEFVVQRGAVEGAISRLAYEIEACKRETTPDALTESCQTQKRCDAARQVLICKLFQLLQAAMDSAAMGGQVRRLMDGGLPAVILHIVSHAQYYGATLLVAANKLLSEFVNHEPSSLSALQEAGVTDAVLHALLVRPLPAASGVLQQLPTVLSALCLNQRGLDDFMRLQPFDRLFAVLLSPPHVAVLRRKNSSSLKTVQLLGCAVDQLIRHQPSIRADATRAIVQLFRRLVTVATPDASRTSDSPSNSGSSLADGELKEAVAEAEAEADADAEAEKWVPEFTSNALQFLHAMLVAPSGADASLRIGAQAAASNATSVEVCRELVKQGLVEPLVALTSAPVLPLTFFADSSELGLLSDAIRSLCNASRDADVLRLVFNPLRSHFEAACRSLDADGSSLLPQLADALGVASYDIRILLDGREHMRRLVPSLHLLASLAAHVAILENLVRHVNVELRTSMAQELQTERYMLDALGSLYQSLIRELAVLNIARSQLDTGSALQDHVLQTLDAVLKSSVDEPQRRTEYIREVLNLASSVCERLATALHALLVSITRFAASLAVGTTRPQRFRFAAPLPAPASEHVSLSNEIVERVAASLNALLRTAAGPGRNCFARALSTAQRVAVINFVISLLFDSTTERGSRTVIAHALARKLHFDLLFDVLRVSLDEFAPLNESSNTLDEESKAELNLLLETYLRSLTQLCDATALLESTSTSASASASSSAPASSPSALPSIALLVALQRESLAAVSELWKRDGGRFWSAMDATSVELALGVIRQLLTGARTVRERVKTMLQQPATPQSTSSTATALPTAPSNTRTSSRPNEAEASQRAIHLQTLMDMGFPREQCVEALNRHRTVETAAQWLLDNPQPTASEMEVELNEEDQLMRAIELSLGGNGTANTTSTSTEPSASNVEPTASESAEAMDATFSSTSGESYQQTSQMEAEKPQSENVDTITRFSVLLDELNSVENCSAMNKSLCGELHTFLENNLMQMCLHLVDLLPDSLFHIVDVLCEAVAAEQRSLQAAQSKKDNDDDNSSLQFRLLQALCEDARRASLCNTNCDGLRARLHFLALLFTRIPTDCARFASRNALVDWLLSLLDYDGLGRALDDKCRTLVFLLLDAYERASTSAARRKILDEVRHASARSWFWKDDTRRWSPYEAQVQHTIDEAFVRGERHVTIRPQQSHAHTRLGTTNASYQIAFDTMTQINLQTGFRRDVLFTVDPSTLASGAQSDEAAFLKLAPDEWPVRLSLEQAQQALRYVLTALERKPLAANLADAALRLAVRLTRCTSLARYFDSLGGTRRVLLVQAAHQFGGSATLVTLLLRHAIEDESTLSSALERTLRTYARPVVPGATQRKQYRDLHALMRQLAPLACRDTQLLQNVALQSLRPHVDADRLQLQAAFPVDLQSQSTSKAARRHIILDADQQQIVNTLLHLLVDLSDASNVACATHTRATTAGTSQSLTDAERDSIGRELRTCFNLNDAADLFDAAALAQPDLDSQRSGTAKNTSDKGDIRLLSRTSVLRVLCELAKCYPNVAAYIASYRYNASELVTRTSSLVVEDRSVLSVLFDFFVPLNALVAVDEDELRAHSEALATLYRTSMQQRAAITRAAEALLCVVGQVTGAPAVTDEDPQVRVVGELKLALQRAAALVDSSLKHAYVRAFAQLVSAMLGCCESASPVPNAASGRRGTSSRLLSIVHGSLHLHSFVKLLFRKGVHAQLALLVRSLPLGDAQLSATLGRLLEPLESLTKVLQLMVIHAISLQRSSDANVNGNTHRRIGTNRRSSESNGEPHPEAEADAETETEPEADGQLESAQPVSDAFSEQLLVAPHATSTTVVESTSIATASTRTVVVCGSMATRNDSSSTSQPRPPTETVEQPSETQVAESASFTVRSIRDSLLRALVRDDDSHSHDASTVGAEAGEHLADDPARREVARRRPRRADTIDSASSAEDDAAQDDDELEDVGQVEAEVDEGEGDDVDENEEDEDEDEEDDELENEDIGDEDDEDEEDDNPAFHLLGGLLVRNLLPTHDGLAAQPGTRAANSHHVVPTLHPLLTRSDLDTNASSTDAPQPGRVDARGMTEPFTLGLPRRGLGHALRVRVHLRQNSNQPAPPLVPTSALLSRMTAQGRSQPRTTPATIGNTQETRRPYRDRVVDETARTLRMLASAVELDLFGAHEQELESRFVDSEDLFGAPDDEWSSTARDIGFGSNEAANGSNVGANASANVSEAQAVLTELRELPSSYRRWVDEAKLLDNDEVALVGTLSKLNVLRSLEMQRAQLVRTIEEERAQRDASKRLAQAAHDDWPSAPLNAAPPPQTQFEQTPNAPTSAALHAQLAWSPDSPHMELEHCSPIATPTAAVPPVATTFDAPSATETRPDDTQASSLHASSSEAEAAQQTQALYHEHPDNENEAAPSIPQPSQVEVLVTSELSGNVNLDAEFNSEATSGMQQESTTVPGATATTSENNTGAEDGAGAEAEGDEIDPSFLEALPEDIRHEVIASHEEQRRRRRVQQHLHQLRTAFPPTAASTSNAQSTPGSIPASSVAGLAVNSEFLAALPLPIQEEVLLDFQRSEHARLSGGTLPQPADFDPAAVFAMMAPDARRQILADMDDSQLAALPADLRREAEALRAELMAEQERRFADEQRFFNTQQHRARMTEITTRLRHGDNSLARHLLRAHAQLHESVTRQDDAFGMRGPSRSVVDADVEAEAAADAVLGKLLKSRVAFDWDAIGCLLLVLFVDGSRSQFDSLCRILRNLAESRATRDWLLRTCLAILEKCAIDAGNLTDAVADVDPDDEWLQCLPRTNGSSWFSRVGERSSASVLELVPSAADSTRYRLTIRPRAALAVARNVIEALLGFAKPFGDMFLPRYDRTRVARDDLHSDADGNKKNSQSKKDRKRDSSFCSKVGSASAPKKSETSPDNDFWHLLLKMDSATSSASAPSTATSSALPMEIDIDTADSLPTKRYKKASNSTENAAETDTVADSDDGDLLSGIDATVLRELNSSEFVRAYPSSLLARLLALISAPAIRGDTPVCDLLFKLLAQVAQTNSIHSAITSFADKSKQVSAQASSSTAPNTMDTDSDTAESSSNVPMSVETCVFLRHVRTTIDILTSKAVSEDGLAEATSLLLNLGRSAPSFRNVIIVYLLAGSRQLGLQVATNLEKLLIELLTSLPNESSSISGNPAMRGTLRNRFDELNVVVVNGPMRTRPGNELHMSSMALFSGKNNSQSYLLRLVNVLLCLLNERSRSNQSSHPRVALSQLLQIDQLWDVLGKCLSALDASQDPLAVLLLQPTVEAFFLVHADPHSSDATRTRSRQPITQRDRDREPREDAKAKANEVINAALAVFSTDSNQQQPPALQSHQFVTVSEETSRFLRFAETHRRVLNQILRQSSGRLSDGTFACLAEHTRILDFDVKRRHFRSELERFDDPRRFEDTYLRVPRERVLQESFKQLNRKSIEEWKGRFVIHFDGEEGQDAGGLLREWYMVMSRDIFNPGYALFKTAAGNRNTYTINPKSDVNSEHLEFFKFIGMFIAKAIYDNKLLECYFTRAFYKHILGVVVKHNDMENEDNDLYKGLVFLLENDIELLGYEQPFTLEQREFGACDTIELKPNGKSILVSNENKHEYVKLVCQEKMTRAVREQLKAFLTGFYSIIPYRLISIFNEQELELLISGLPQIDVDDLKANTEYRKYNADSIQIKWFWRALKSFDQAERARFLQFVTGTSRVPLAGFAHLEGMNGPQKFTIQRDDRSTDRLPCAHTCFNQIDLPLYESYEKLRATLLKAVNECSEGFGFA